MFISFQRSPAQFIALQKALATDKLNDYIRHIDSAVFAVPPGASEGRVRGGGAVPLTAEAVGFLRSRSGGERYEGIRGFRRPISSRMRPQVHVRDVRGPGACIAFATRTSVKEWGGQSVSAESITRRMLSIFACQSSYVATGSASYRIVPAPDRSLSENSRSAIGRNSGMSHSLSMPT